MHILIIGAAGMIGRKLTDRLSKDGGLGGQPIEKLTFADVVETPAPQYFDGRVDSVIADLGDPAIASKLVVDRPDVIFHIAAVVSGEAEANFEKGYRANLDATRFLLEAIRKEGESIPYKPRLVFTSSLAVYGTPFPDEIGDEFVLTPLSSYGTQKTIGELLLADYSRRGFIDGIGVRLPTICIRPGTPNKAASGFFSNILREPLVGLEATLPVSRDVRHWFASPRSAVQFLIHAATIDLQPLGWRRSLNMPGLSATVGEQIDALGRVAGEKATRLIRVESNADIAKIIEGWPRAFEAKRARELGFTAERSMDEIIQAHIEDELGGNISS